MVDNDKVFNTYRRSPGPGLLQVGEDFEDRVFAKIKRKKKIRRNIAAAAAGFALAGFLFLAQALVFHKKPETITTAKQETTIKREAREEIPIMDDVVFASSDSRAAYAIEQVSLTQDDDTIY